MDAETGGTSTVPVSEGKIIKTAITCDAISEWDSISDFAKLTGIPTVYFIHMSHEAGLHAETDRELPENIRLAYDGLEVNF